MFKSLFVIFVTIFCAGVFSSEQLIKADDGDDGIEAYDGVFPWATYIEILDDNTMEYQFECFGSIIGPSWVFVQARCFTRTIHNTYRLYFGNVNFTQSEISMISRNYYIHPEHNNIYVNNGGLIELPIPLTFTGTISPISLPFNINDEQFIGTNAYFIGRRHMVNPVTEISHTIVRWNTLEIISDEHCDSLNTVRVTTEMCALGTVENPRKTPCESFGHLAVYFNTKYILIGGGGDDYCSDTVRPSYFPRMSVFLEWITNVTNISE